MRVLLTSTAIALLAASPLAAQETQTEGAGAETAQKDVVAVGVLFLSAEQDSLYASDLLGMDVHSSEADYDAYREAPIGAADRSEWDDIGDVNDIIIGPEGDARGVLVDIGGFLGLGEHTVALDMSQVRFLTDETGDRFVAVNSTREELENAPKYERPDEMMNAATTAPPGGDVVPPMTVSRPMFEREGYMEAEYQQLTAEQLEGAPVYDANDESIGDVSELVLGQDGTITQAIVDVGGFLGMGEHPVALEFGEMQVMQNADGGDVRVYIDQTRENLEQRPAYEG